ncbi:Protein CBG02908 [Caenorhabditis briggsae]|uniref:Uncharacterized protein n=2 Tax=Caenorhabditis briggsae TaxID=6238 RepID=A0AAE9DKN5_CAEBR|nr:Protein CBG02908 [Caenorhabditis briggsae]ULU06122.1 hypothetical protein L3Y34_018187 [Caenorhabditis briggsae]CAP23699.2 Protein CBG02908 [Caenorhabditis briggsae]
MVEVADNLVAYDRRNEFLNIPENEIHVITEAIDNYKPKLSVQFIDFQHVKRRKATVTKDGKVRILTNVKHQQKAKIENVKVDSEVIQLRFGGGSKAHYPYNRVVDWRRRNEQTLEESHEETTTPTKPSLPPVTPKSWAKTTTTTLAPYSAEPALILPSRFHRKKEDVVIVFKKKQKA